MSAELPRPRRLSPVELLREWRLLRDLAGMALDRGRDLPRGRAAVLVIPGFGAGDAATVVLRRRLTALGHAVIGWGLGVNRGRVDQDLPRLQQRFDRFREDQGGAPIHLVGWSLGGVLARDLARSRPDAVCQIITLGSPLLGGPKYTYTARGYERQGYDLDRLEAKVAEREARLPLPCPLLSLYSPDDGMVHPGASIDPYHPEAEHQAVRSSHLGMCVSPAVLRIVAQRLAGADRRD